MTDETKVSMNCPVCGGGFGDRFDLIEHVRQKHPDVFWRMQTMMPSLVELNTRKSVPELRSPLEKKRFRIHLVSGRNIRVRLVRDCLLFGLLGMTISSIVWCGSTSPHHTSLLFVAILGLGLGLILGAVMALSGLDEE